MNLPQRMVIAAALTTLLPPMAVLADTVASVVAIRIAGSIPRSWTVADRKSGALPEGHYWGLDYEGARGEEITLQGDADVRVHWQDSKNEWRTDVVGKEALKVYVMPSTYRESVLRYFVPKRPVAARLLIETKYARIYAYPTFRVTEATKLSGILKEAKAVRWPDSPENTGSLSWATWDVDLSRSLSGAL